MKSFLTSSIPTKVKLLKEGLSLYLWIGQQYVKYFTIQKRNRKFHNNKYTYIYVIVFFWNGEQVSVTF